MTEPKTADDWYKKGLDSAKLGNHEEAIHCYDKALEIDPIHVLAWHYKGAALFRLDREEEAQACFGKASELKQPKTDPWEIVKQLSDVKKGLDYRADIVSKELGLDPEGVKSVYNKCNDIGWVLDTPVRPTTGLDLAFRDLEPQKALELFESSDLEQLRTSYNSFKRLTHLMLEPFCTIPELAKLVSSFLVYQKRHREHIIKTGFPKQVFHKSPWLDWHLSRLYYVKAPVNPQRIIDEPDKPSWFYIDNPELWEGKNTEYYSIWVREYSQTTDNGVLQKKISNKIHYSLYQFCQIRDGEFIIPNGEIAGEKCSYSEAPYFDFLSDDMVSRLESLREKVFDIRLEVLSKIHTALTHKNSDNLWEDCLSELANLDFDEVQFLLKMDRQFINTIYDINDFHSYKWLSNSHRNAGLIDIFQVIGHVEKELTIGNIHEAAFKIESVVNKHGITSYFQVLGTKWQKKTDKALEIFVSLRKKEMDFYNRFHDKVNQWLNKESKSKYRYESLIGQINNYVLSHRHKYGRLPDFDPSMLVPTIFEEGTDDNVIRNLGDFWLIRFNGVLVGLIDDSIGLHHISQLLRHPNREMHVSDLIRSYYKPDHANSKYENTDYVSHDNQDKEEFANSDCEQSDTDRSDPGRNRVQVDSILDADTVDSYTKRLEAIPKESVGAEARGDLHKVADLDREKKMIEDELKKNRDIFGKSRQFSHQTEKDRKSVSKAIHSAISDIEQCDPPFAEYLNTHLEIGTECMYKDAKRTSWKS